MNFRCLSLKLLSWKPLLLSFLYSLDSQLESQKRKVQVISNNHQIRLSGIKSHMKEESERDGARLDIPMVTREMRIKTCRADDELMECNSGEEGELRSLFLQTLNQLLYD